MTKLGVPQQSQSQQLGLTMNNVHLSNVPYEIHPAMQLKVSNNNCISQKIVELFYTIVNNFLYTRTNLLHLSCRAVHLVLNIWFI